MPFSRLHTRPAFDAAAQPVLPAQYYLDHFDEFLDVIRDRYRPVLDAEHNAFLADFERLNRSARCLYVRLLNRRGRIFDSGRLRYVEIDDVPGQLDALTVREFVRGVDDRDFDDWLQIISKEALLSLLTRQCSPGSYRRSWSKSALLDFAKDNLSAEHPATRDAMAPFVVQRRGDQVGYLLFLYFGRYEQSLTRFTLRDLGVVNSNRFNASTRPRFECRDVAMSSWFYCRKLSEVEACSDAQYATLAESVSDWPKANGEQSVVLRQKVVYQLGERIERYGDKALAEQVYAHCEAWPASERRLRLIYGRGDREQAKTLLEAMIDDPDCDEELLFAEDFYARKFDRKRTSKLTDLLRGGAVLDVDESWRDMPEQGAAAHLRGEGATVFHTENRLWKTLFGLLFWDILFEAEDAAIYNDFEKRPADLDTGVLYQRFKKQIEQRIVQLTQTGQTLNRLLKTVTAHYGKPNSVFYWRPNMLDEIQLFLEAAPASAAGAILRRMCQDFAGNRSGFPDLLVLENDQARFVEVKAEGDQLRRNQLKQFVALRDAGFEVEINRVRWRVNADQIYVVVDIETTGRRSSANRITEIAAVKMRGNQIIDEWQSLLNPCRRIPGNITTLTGINDEMVADAPRFSEVADEFRRFSEDAIFVAHNVRFDYGFISDEYRRLEQSYHRPTLCSVVQMRKWYPGYKSYSLKNLCAEFDIDLESHHRAMCDAKAAAALLELVNLRRLEDQNDTSVEN